MSFILLFLSLFPCLHTLSHSSFFLSHLIWFSISISNTFTENCAILLFYSQAISLIISKSLFHYSFVCVLFVTFFTSFSHRLCFCLSIATSHSKTYCIIKYFFSLFQSQFFMSIFVLFLPQSALPSLMASPIPLLIKKALYQCVLSCNIFSHHFKVTFLLFLCLRCFCHILYFFRHRLCFLLSITTSHSKKYYITVLL